MSGGEEDKCFLLFCIPLLNLMMLFAIVKAQESVFKWNKTESKISTKKRMNPVLAMQSADGGMT